MRNKSIGNGLFLFSVFCLLISSNLAETSEASSFAGMKCSEIEAIVNRESFQHITITDVMAEAAENHPLVEKSRLAYQNSIDDVTIARSARYPQINLNFETGVTHNPINQARLGDIDTENLGLNANWLLFDFGATRNLILAANSRVERAHSTIENQEYSTAITAAQAYIAVLTQRLALDYSLAAYKDFRKIKELLTSNKLASEKDTAKALQLKESVCSSARKFLQDHGKATNFFESVLNYNPENFFLVEPEQVGVELDVDQSIALAMNNHPSFAMLQAQKREASQLVTAAKRERLPKTSLIASTHSYDHVSSDFGDRSRDGWYVGVRVTVPLSTGGRLSANVRKAQRNEESLSLDEEILVRYLRREISNLVEAIQISADRLNQLNTVMQTSEKIYNDRLQTLTASLDNGQQVDSQNLLNLLDERSNLYKSQVEVNALYYSLILDRFTLLAQQGLLLKELSRN